MSIQRFNTLDDAIELAKYAHRHQQDKAGLPYIQHPLRVLAKVQAQGVLPYVQMAAILHDVPEDTAFSHDMLLSLGFSEAVVSITRLLDRGVSDDPTDPSIYYRRIAMHPGAKVVKLADISDNLEPWRLAYLSTEKQNKLKDKYAFALSILTEH